MSPRKLLMLAAKLSRTKIDERHFCLGAVAIRNDDVMVCAYNGHPGVPTPKTHCEARLVRKLDKGATVYLARTAANGDWANSKPCPDCQRAMRRAKVKKVFYTTAPNAWESMEF